MRPRSPRFGRVRASTSDNEFVDAVREMLTVLGDPATRVVRVPEQHAGRTEPLSLTQAQDGTLVVRAGSFIDTALLQKQIAHLRGIFDGAQRVIFDVRAHSDTPTFSSILFSAYGLDSLLSFDEMRAPAQRRRIHLGYESRVGAEAAPFTDPDS